MSGEERLPPGWTAAPLSELVRADAPIIYGILQPGPDTPGGIPYVRPTEISDGEIDLGAIRRTTPQIAARYVRSRLQTGDVLLSIVGTIGKVAFVPPDLDGANITQSSVRIRPDERVVTRDWLAHALHSPTAREFYKQQRLGTGVPRLNVAQVRDLTIPVPPLAEQRRIVAKLDELLASSRVARAALDAVPALLEQYRQTVFGAAVSGELSHEWRVRTQAVKWRDLSLADITPAHAPIIYGILQPGPDDPEVFRTFGRQRFRTASLI